MSCFCWYDDTFEHMVLDHNFQNGLGPHNESVSIDVIVMVAV